MAAGVMTASLLLLSLLGCFLQVFGRGEVFGWAPGAHAVFLRSKRANQFLVEEILQGNLERECYEEQCNYEEAREVFEDDKLTVAFWTVYYDGDQCKPNPCLNGGNCTDKVGGFSCSCIAPNYGPICERKLPHVRERPSVDSQTTPTAEWKSGAYKNKRHEMSECPTQGPTACHQLCTAAYNSFTCSCMLGFKLQSDGRSCLPEVRFPCGRLPEARESDCHHGNCPWQVSLINSNGVELCGGVVLGRRAVLTSASCFFLASGSDFRPSDFYVTRGNRKLSQVQAVHLHDRFRLDQHDYDLALLELAFPLPFGPNLIHLCLPTKDFCENILMHSGKTGVAARRGRGQTQDLLYMTLDECRGQLNVSHPLTNKMFCMKSQKEPPGNPKGAQRRQNVLSENKTEPSGSQNLTLSPNRLLGNLDGRQRKSDGRTLNRFQNLTQNGTQNEARLSNSSSVNHYKSSPGGVMLRSEVRRTCEGFRPGSPVATVEKGTAFLTGLLTSTSSDCDGQVFTKVSRYLNWITPRLQATEDLMTPQISQYPKDR